MAPLGRLHSREDAAAVGQVRSAVVGRYDYELLQHRDHTSAPAPAPDHLGPSLLVVAVLVHELISMSRVASCGLLPGAPTTIARYN